MSDKKPDNTSNTLNLDGKIYKTSGNIVFCDNDQDCYIIAQSTLLDDFDGILENGMQTLLKKFKR